MFKTIISKQPSKHDHDHHRVRKDFDKRKDGKIQQGKDRNIVGFKGLVNYSSFVCEFCGFESKNKNKRQDKEDHIIKVHFKAELDKIFPSLSKKDYSPGKVII